MIGMIKKGKDCYGLLRYSLNDKKELSEEDKIAMSKLDGLQHKGRAEVLEYNLCYGSAKEVAAQFREVEKLSSRTEFPVFHITMRLAAGDQLSHEHLIEVGRACAREFGVSDHQYVCILHKDSNEQHIHLVANRVGFDGKAANDSNSYRRMAKLSRELEKKYLLQPVLSPRRFLSAEERLLPRSDSRRQKLKDDIRKTLANVSDYAGFERHMKALGYQVFKGRGIYFIDDKKVRIKGSEVGFSLSKIEQVLQHTANVNTKSIPPEGQIKPNEKPQEVKVNLRRTNQDTPLLPPENDNQKSLLEELLQAETTRDYNDPFSLKQARKKKKKRRPLL